MVRIGDYKQDSYFGQGQGETEFAPVENDVFALRHALWLATDTAYKEAGEALAAKQAMMKTLTLNESVDDFAHAEPLVAVESAGEVAIGRAADQSHAGGGQRNLSRRS